MKDDKYLSMLFKSKKQQEKAEVIAGIISIVIGSALGIITGLLIFQ